MKKKGRNVSTLGQKMTRNTDKIRKIAFKLRGGLWTALYLGVLFLAGPASIPALAAGLILVAIGQSVRFWAAGCITRYRGENVGAERLVTWGPYALVRNPHRTMGGDLPENKIRPGIRELRQPHGTFFSPKNCRVFPEGTL